MYKRLILTFALLSVVIGKPFELNPVLKSAIMPGWGEAVLEKNKRARPFFFHRIITLDNMPSHLHVFISPNVTISIICGRTCRCGYR